MKNNNQKAANIFLPQSVPPHWLLWVSIGYLFFPFLIFTVGWLKVWLSFPLVLLSIFIFYRFSKLTILEQKSPDKFSMKFLLILALIALCWCLLSGIGGVFFQRFDYLKHNAIFRELAINNWPVYFPMSSYADGPAWLNYYISWYLPPALFSKIFGVGSIEFVSLLWSWWGTWLVLVWVVNLVQGKWWIGTLTFMLFGGIELLVILYQGVEHLFDSGFDKTYIYHILRTGWEVAFANKVFRYMAHTVLLTWSPQFAIGIWLATAMVWYFLKHKQYTHFILPIGSVSLLWSPMATIGLALACLCLFQKWQWHHLFSPMETIVSVFITSIMFAYYAAHMPLGMPIFTFFEIPLAIFIYKYPLFLIIEYFALVAIIWAYWKNEERIQIGLLCILLALLPLIKLGYNNDWLIQTGVAPLFILTLFIARFLAVGQARKLKGWKRYVLMIMLLCMIANPVRYFFISLFRPVIEPSLVTSVPVKDSPGLEETGFLPNTGKQYLARDQTFFYEILARSKGACKE